jgi:hypothetical protein
MYPGALMATAVFSPLPGDLVVQPEPALEVDPPGGFRVYVWPNSQVSVGPYVSYEGALRVAQKIAERRRALVWLEDGYPLCRFSRLS